MNHQSKGNYSIINLIFFVYICCILILNLIYSHNKSNFSFIFEINNYTKVFIYKMIIYSLYENSIFIIFGYCI